jgi:hypothetical protein
MTLNIPVDELDRYSQGGRREAQIILNNRIKIHNYSRDCHPF